MALKLGGIIHVTFCGSWKQSFLKYMKEKKNLLRRKSREYRTMEYLVSRTITQFSTTKIQNIPRVVVFTNGFRHTFSYIFFSFRTIFLNILT